MLVWLDSDALGEVARFNTLPVVAIDGAPIGVLLPGGYLYHEVAPGEHMVSVSASYLWAYDGKAYALRQVVPVIVATGDQVSMRAAVEVGITGRSTLLLARSTSEVKGLESARESINLESDGKLPSLGDGARNGPTVRIVPPAGCQAITVVVDGRFVAGNLDHPVPVQDELLVPMSPGQHQVVVIWFTKNQANSLPSDQYRLRVQRRCTVLNKQIPSEGETIRFDQARDYFGEYLVEAVMQPTEGISDQ
ncbi:MAG: hypothetical protein IT438_00485 [Phycisphaerales bacterium]|nr:hypothetical protein [Phycisphaerales bacterium]